VAQFTPEAKDQSFSSSILSPEVRQATKGTWADCTTVGKVLFGPCCGVPVFDFFQISCNIPSDLRFHIPTNPL